MPIYEYDILDSDQGPCEQCGAVREELRRMSDAPLTACTRCNRPLRRRMSVALGRLDKLAPGNLADKGFKVLRKTDKGGVVEDRGYKLRGERDD